MGDTFHRLPRDYAYYFDPYRPDEYESRLDFTDLLENARWAGWMFDIPEYDTDGDGYRGAKWPVNCTPFGCDSLYYKGDGVPDFHGPTPPTPPPLEVTTKPSKVRLRWSGAVPETEIDPMSGVRDFEGYLIYSGRFNANDHMSLIASWDIIDYKRRRVCCCVPAARTHFAAAIKTVETVIATIGVSPHPTEAGCQKAIGPL